MRDKPGGAKSQKAKCSNMSTQKQPVAATPSLLHAHTHTFACQFYLDHWAEMSQPADKSGNLRVIMNPFASLSSLHMWKNSKRTQPVQLQISCSFPAGWSPSPDCIIIIPIILITLSPVNLLNDEDYFSCIYHTLILYLNMNTRDDN